MDCIVHGVTKSRTWLSDFHKMRPIKTPQVIQAVTDHAAVKDPNTQWFPKLQAYFSHKPPVVERSHKCFFMTAQTQKVLRPRVKPCDFLMISCFFPRDYPAPWVSSVFVFHILRYCFMTAIDTLSFPYYFHHWEHFGFFNLTYTVCNYCLYLLSPCHTYAQEALSR